MAKRLIIAEKPSVARDIAYVLNCRESAPGCYIGDSDLVTWAVGHLVGLCYPDEIDEKYAEWKLEDLPIFPEPFQLKVLESGKKQFEIVKSLMTDPEVDRIVCATDAGREGELIFRYIYQMTGCDKPVDRLWISSLTYRAIKVGFENLKPDSEYDNLYQSARCRSEADWLVGMNGSRAYAIENEMRRLSVGRVLSPTLAILVRRELERRNFVPEEYCEVIAFFGEDKDHEYMGRLINDEPSDQWAHFLISEKSKLEEYVSQHSQTGEIVFSKNEEESQPPQQLYDLTSLQRDANRIYGMSSKWTLEKFKYEIGRDTTDGMTFLDIIELYPVCEGSPKRVLMFKIPAAVAGMPTGWKTRYYARNGESLVLLQQYKIDMIRNQQRRDWSRQILPGATIDHLDRGALEFAREKYKEKMNKPHISEEVDGLSDEEFLTKLKLMTDGKLTNAAMVLLGSADYDGLFDSAPSMMWRLFSTDGTVKDYEIFGIPFLTVTDKVFARIRNLTYRYMPNQLSLFPKETQQYDIWLLRELMNNCIAHTNYLLGGRIYVNEEDDCISIVNPGDFLPQTVETVLQKTYNPPFYRNQLLADAMVKFHMIDTATSGIKKVYRIQKEKYFPMPDYDLMTANQVSVKGIITTDSPNQQLSHWILVDSHDDSNKIT